MVLHTAPVSEHCAIMQKLDTLEISYTISIVNEIKINVFFGDRWCIGVIRSFEHLDLSRLTDEQDFILGTLLGYDIVIQCRRYLKRKRHRTLLGRVAKCNTNFLHEPESAYAM